MRSTGQREPIDPNLSYPIAAFKKAAGVGDAWLRSARRDGLRVIYTGGRGFIRGRDFCRYLDEVAEREAAAQNQNAAAPNGHANGSGRNGF